MDDCTIIGVDCATDPKNVGLARGFWRNGKLCITEVSNGLFEAPERIICKWIVESEARLPVHGPCWRWMRLSVGRKI